MSDLTKSTIQNLVDLLRNLKVQEATIESIKKDLHFTEADPIMKSLLELQTKLNDKVAVKTISKFQTP